MVDIAKKSKLTYRVVVSPVPPEFDFHQIAKHKIFNNQVVSYKYITGKLIVELDDIDTYKYCLDAGALRIREYVLLIEVFDNILDPNNTELDAANWYETTMLEIKPDITTIMDNYKHPIFSYKWNANNWIQQFAKAKRGDRRANNEVNLKRHLLRVTVMLNTIGVLRKGKYFVDDQEVKLNVQKLYTVGYDHRSKLSFGKKVHESELKTKFKSTTVKVVNADCLVLYERLVAEGYRPLLLNMANATSPGVGYRKGNGGQEENIVRRSDYYHSLDAELADRNRSVYFACTSKCDLKQLKCYNCLYPMDEFGAIYTSGITVFRQTEKNGYAFMRKPMYDVCSIAMAAYRNPPVTSNNMLKNKVAINTRKKIENIFAIGHHQKHDCLVLSAFGCGGYENPPTHVALLFKSVIHQYAGYFNKIYFAIVDDHNTGNQINPHGNFLPFQRELDNLVVAPPETFRTNGVSGPYRILNRSTDGQLRLSDATICYLPPCQWGAKCRDIKDAQHNNSFLHPPMCPLQTTTTVCDQMDDEVHLFTFAHIMKCKDGGLCNIKDPKHLSEYDHPDYCEDESNSYTYKPEYNLLSSATTNSTIREPSHVHRFSDLVAGPVDMLLPIQGYEKLPIVSLEEAIIPLIPIIEDVENMVWISKEKCTHPKDGLTRDESASIMLYTMEWEPCDKSFYVLLNAALRSAKRDKLKPWFSYLRLVVHAFQKLPSINHTIYRGINGNLSGEYRRGETIIWWGFSSCTRSIEILNNEKFLCKTGERTFFNIECQSGKNIRSHSFYEDEEEILLLPARQFEVMGCVDQGNGLRLVQLKETKPKFPLLKLP